MAVPLGFLEAVGRAGASADCGLLRLLASEIERVPWATEARRHIAEAEATARCPSTPTTTLVFSGHMVDGPDRPSPRFPPEAVDAAREAIRLVVEDEHRARGVELAVAGAASGGDILFLEVAQAAGIPTQILLPGPTDEFVARSVAPAGDGWVERFDRVCTHARPQILNDHIDLPEWLVGAVDYSVWERNNRWILATALRAGGPDTTLIGLWDGQAGDGRGGTAHMVEQARAHGARVIVIDPAALFN